MRRRARHRWATVPTTWPGTTADLAPAGADRSGRGPGTSTGYLGAAGAWVVGGPRHHEPGTGTRHAIPVPQGAAVGQGAAVAWTGQELIVWGDIAQANGADQATGLASTPPLPPS